MVVRKSERQAKDNDCVLMMEPLLNLLIVEDSQAERELMQVAMDEAGLTPIVSTVFACDGEEALNAVKAPGSGPFDMVLLDLNLPKISGRDVLSHIKSMPKLKDTRVIIMSNSDCEEDMADCHSRGANGYLQKPQDFEKLVDLCIAIRQSLEHTESVTALANYKL